MSSDEELMMQMRQGCEQAFETLYERYEQKLYGFIYRKLGNRQDTDEIFQEAMMTILKNIHIEFSRGGFAPWIYKISLNLCLNLRRRKTTVNMGESIDESTDPQESQDAILINRESHFKLAQAVGKLPTTLSDLYKMWAEGQTYEDMSQKTKLPIGTVKSRLHTAIARLRQEII